MNLKPTFNWKKPLHVGIRAQLMLLVSSVAIISLLILAISTGVYFTSDYKDLRSEQLYIAAQLKSSQIDQTLELLYYQCLWLTTRDAVEDSLVSYVAGNKTEENWAEAKDLLEKFLGSSAIYSVATIYDTHFNSVLNTTNNNTGNEIPAHVLNSLLPLSGDAPLPTHLGTTGLLTDPVRNGSSYLMSMSLPIFANPSIVLTGSRVYGYLTVIMSAASISAVYNDTTALENSIVVIASAIYTNSSVPSEYHFVFPPYASPSNIINVTYPIRNDTFLYDAFNLQQANTVRKTKFFFSKTVALGYSPCQFALANWVATVSQPESVFISPSIKLTKIIAGTVVAIAFFMCCLTFVFSYLAVKPIIRLQRATELISQGRGLKPHSGSSATPNTSNSPSRRNSEESHKSVLKFKNINKGNDSNFQMSQNNSVAQDAKRSESKEETPVSDIPNLKSIQARVPKYRRYVKDELSELTDTFNVMTDALDEHYNLLEDRVKERTKQLEAAKVEAESANEAKTVFIANISHELRTPLNGILGMTAIAVEEDDQEKIQSSLKLIFRSGELLLHILTELLTFSKNVLKTTNLEKVNFSVTDVALQIKSIFGKTARDQHVHFSILILPNHLRTMILWGDCNRIIQIVMNLVSNALKFTPDDGTVKVRISLLGEYDKDRSESNNHSKVFVKDGTEPEDHKVSGEEPENLVKNTESIIEEEAISPPILRPALIDKTESSDTASISTDCSSVYNQVLFQQQFKKSIAGDEEEEPIGSPVSNSKTWVIKIEVEDTGPGIEPKLQNSVFEPFVQGDQTLSRQYGGTGLGLSICRQLATMMNGTMELTSEINVGSKFIFTVPLLQTREVTFADGDANFEDEFNADSKKNRKVKFKRASGDKPSPQKSKWSAKYKNDRPILQSTGTARSSDHVTTLSDVKKDYNVLVVEDNKVNQEVIKRMLKLEKISEISLACDGQEAIDKVQEIMNLNSHFDLILMDIQMPRIDGLIATKKIRNELNYDKPIVALTAFADESNIKECYNSGMNGFIAKPIKRFQLKDILQQFAPETTHEQ